MAIIAFVLDHEEGHIIPTLKLARQLAARGHKVRYLGLPDSADFVRRQGFDFVPILEKSFPPGFIRELREEAARDIEAQKDDTHARIYGRYLGAAARGEGLDGPVLRTRPDLFILNSLLGLNALVMDYRYGRPVVLLTPLLRTFSKAQHAETLETVLTRLDGAAEAFFSLVQQCDPGARRFRDVTSRLLRMRELVQCPRELELPENLHAEDEELFHIEASIDPAWQDDRDGDHGFPWDRIDPRRKLLYVSLGSQAYLGGRPRVAAFLRAVAEGAARRPEWQLVLSTGGIVEPGDLPLPPDAVALPWVPQIPLLERTAVMVTHGGLGTVKECIVRGVPMLVCPVARDQPENARRVAHHGLGLAGDFAAPSAEGLFEQVERIDSDPSFRDNMERMRRRFLEIEESGIGVRLIEEVLQRRH
jgi:MGT family glycosyltransferase